MNFTRLNLQMYIQAFQDLLAPTTVRIRSSAVVDLKLNVRHQMHCTLIVLDGCRIKKGKCIPAASMEL